MPSSPKMRRYTDRPLYFPILGLTAKCYRRSLMPQTAFSQDKHCIGPIIVELHGVVDFVPEIVDVAQLERWNAGQEPAELGAVYMRNKNSSRNRTSLTPTRANRPSRSRSIRRRRLVENRNVTVTRVCPCRSLQRSVSSSEASIGSRWNPRI